MNSRKKVLSIINIMLAGILLVAMISYAYFSYRRTESLQEVYIASKNLQITFSNSSNVTLYNAQPGDTSTKTVTIVNTGNDTTTYDLLWTTITNEFIAQNEMVYSATCTGTGCVALTETQIPISGTNIPIVGNIVIEEGITHIYTFTFTYKETNYAQTVNNYKTINGTIGADTNRRYDITGTILPSTIISNSYTELLSIDTTKDYVLFLKSSEDILFNAYYYDSNEILIGTSGWESYNNQKINMLSGTSTIRIYLKKSDDTAISINNLQHLYLKEVSFTNPNTTSYTSNTLGYAIINGVTPSTPTLTKVAVSTSQYNNPDGTYVTSDPTSGDNTNYVKTNAVAENTKPGYIALSNAVAESGLYKVPGISGKNAYVYRGTLDNNNVFFAGFLWKISRINEDGTIRLMLVNSSSYSSLNTQPCTTSSPTCTNYTYIDNDEELDSLIKQTLEEWYEDNLFEYDNLIENSYFCNDITSNATTIFNASKTYYDCPSGGKIYYLKIGLPMLDDYISSGVSSVGHVKSNYLLDNNTFVMDSYNGGNSLYYVNENNYRLAVGNGITEARYARPVISLKANTEILSGDGSTATPYVIKTSA